LSVAKFSQAPAGRPKRFVIAPSRSDHFRLCDLTVNLRDRAAQFAGLNLA
jgi:hypothetical protein